MRVQAPIHGMAWVEEIHPKRTEGRRLAAIAMVIAFGLFVSLMGVSPARANHVGATLNCGGQEFTVDGQSDLPSGFDQPSPWTGLLLLKGTTQVFKAFVIEGWQTQDVVNPAGQRHNLITCTISFSPTGTWTLHGVLSPRRP